MIDRSGAEWNHATHALRLLQSSELTLFLSSTGLPAYSKWINNFSAFLFCFFCCYFLFFVVLSVQMADWAVQVSDPWFRSDHIHVIKWSCQNTDINFAKNLWQGLKINVHRQSPFIKGYFASLCKTFQSQAGRDVNHNILTRSDWYNKKRVIFLLMSLFYATLCSSIE